MLAGMLSSAKPVVRSLLYRVLDARDDSLLRKLPVTYLKENAPVVRLTLLDLMLRQMNLANSEARFLLSPNLKLATRVG